MDRQSLCARSSPVSLPRDQRAIHKQAYEHLPFYPARMDARELRTMGRFGTKVAIVLGLLRQEGSSSSLGCCRLGPFVIFCNWISADGCPGSGAESKKADLISGRAA